MCNIRLDTRDRFPFGMEEYLSANGWHFNKKMCEWAVSKMKKKDKPLEPWEKEKCDSMLKNNGIDTTEFKGYDYVYVINMCRADYYGSSIIDEPHIALFVKDYLMDVDGYESVAFTRFYADCIGKGTPIIWEDML